MPAPITMPLIMRATNIVATTRGAISRSSGSTPRTSIASISSRILRAPMSEQIAEPAAPAMISAAAIGAASRTTASTALAPANDCAPSCPVRLPTCSEITAPNGIETRMVGISVTLVMNQACSMNSRVWNLVVKTPLVTSETMAAISPGPRTIDAAVTPIATSLVDHSSEQSVGGHPRGAPKSRTCSRFPQLVEHGLSALMNESRGRKSRGSKYAPTLRSVTETTGTGTPSRGLTRHPSALLLAAQLLAVVAYPFLDDSRVGAAALGVISMVAVGLALWVVRSTPALTVIAVVLGAPAITV